MRRIEQYIQTLGIMQAQYSHIRRSESEWQAIETAKDALREKQEREKGCEKCHDKDNLRWYKLSGFSVCPHCDRPLTENNVRHEPGEGNGNAGAAGGH